MYGWFLTGTGFIIMAFSYSLLIAFAGAIFVAMGGPISSLSRLTIIQREVPSFKMGKMFSIGSTMISLTIAISLIAGGPIFSYLNPTAAFLTYGGLILLFSLLGLVSLNKDKQNTDRMVRKKSTEMV